MLLNIHLIKQNFEEELARAQHVAKTNRSQENIINNIMYTKKTNCVEINLLHLIKEHSNTQC